MVLGTLVFPLLLFGLMLVLDRVEERLTVTMGERELEPELAERRQPADFGTGTGTGRPRERSPDSAPRPAA